MKQAKESKKKANSQRGYAGFNEFYSKHWGDRWPALLEALQQPAAKIWRHNRWVHDCALDANWLDRVEIFPVRLASPSDDSEPIENGGLAAEYKMDPASIYPPLALRPQPDDHVLDLCAAPGGKSLILWELMDGRGRLDLNDTSLARVKRLQGVIRQYVPESQRAAIRSYHHEGKRWGLFHREEYDAVLLDAPCSGERHLLKDTKEMSVWSPRRSKGLSIRQFALLSSAWLSLKPGGHLVYSTCSVSPLENDAIIDKLLKRRKDEVEVIPQGWERGEPTQHGWMILPDREKGAGPIYWAKLRKISTPRSE